MSLVRRHPGLAPRSTSDVLVFGFSGPEAAGTAGGAVHRGPALGGAAGGGRRRAGSAARARRRRAPARGVPRPARRGASHADGHLLGMAVAVPELPSDERKAVLRAVLGLRRDGHELVEFWRARHRRRGAGLPDPGMCGRGVPRRTGGGRAAVGGRRRHRSCSTATRSARPAGGRGTRRDCAGWGCPTRSTSQISTQPRAAAARRRCGRTTCPGRRGPAVPAHRGHLRPHACAGRCWSGRAATWGSGCWPR